MHTTSKQFIYLLYTYTYVIYTYIHLFIYLFRVYSPNPLTVGEGLGPALKHIHYMIMAFLTDTRQHLLYSLVNNMDFLHYILV